MIDIHQSYDHIIIKRNKYFLGGIIVATIMAVAGVFIIFGLLPFEDGYTFANVFGLIFVLVWETGTIIGVLYYTREYSKYIIVTESGVSCCTCFKKEFIEWDEIKDWGLSYCGQTRGEGNTYYLYFSKAVFETKNECSKKLKSKMIKTFVFEGDYMEVISKIVPFCKERSDIDPFIGKDKYHFI